MGTLKVKKNSFEQEILLLEARKKVLEDRITTLQSLLKYHKYFHRLRYERNIFIVEMRKQFSLKCLETNMPYSDIGKILCRNHCSVIHLVNTMSNKRIEKIVAENAENWISESKYPRSYFEKIRDVRFKTTHGKEVRYKLVDL